MIGGVDVTSGQVQLSHNGGLVANGSHVHRRVALLQVSTRRVHRHALYAGRTAALAVRKQSALCTFISQLHICRFA